MTKVLAVAKWEYLEKVRSKAFLISLVLTPLIMIGMGILPTFFASREEDRTKVIGLIDETGELAEPFARLMQERYLLADGRPNYVIRPLALGRGISLPEEVAAANGHVAAGEMEGYVLVPARIDSGALLEYRSAAVGDFRLVARIEGSMERVLQQSRSAKLGIDTRVLDQLNVTVDVRTVKLSEGGEEEETRFERVFLSSYMFLMMLFFLIVTSGQLLVRSVIEEKSNRIVEVLVSSVSSTELMAGKVLGLSGLGLTQLGFWAVIGLAGSARFGMDIVRPDELLLLLIYFVLGYLFYAAVFIAAGSPLTTEQEAQQVTSYLVLFLILPIVLALPAMQNPDAFWLKILTFFPPLTPTMMALRIPIQMPSVVEIIGTVLLLLVSIFAAMVAAGRIFRIAILSTGKTPTIAEILRWARTSS